MTQQASGIAPATADREGLDIKVRSQLRLALSRFARHRVAMVSLVILAAIVVVAFNAEHVTPYSYDGMNLRAARLAPTLEGGHFFGTDKLGQTTLPACCSVRVPRSSWRWWWPCCRR